MRDGEAKEIDVKTGAFPDEFTARRAPAACRDQSNELANANLLA